MSSPSESPISEDSDMLSFLELPVEMLVQVLAHCDSKTLQSCDATCTTLRNVISFHGRELCEAATVTLPSEKFRRSYPNFPYREFALYRPLDGDFARSFQLTEFGKNTFYGFRVEVRERRTHEVNYAETTFRCVKYRSDDVHHKIYSVFDALQPTIRIEFDCSTKHCDDCGVLHYCTDCTNDDVFMEYKNEDGSPLMPFEEEFLDADNFTNLFTKFFLPRNELRPQNYVFFRNAWFLEVKMEIELPL